jgi:hypothetical protein
MHLERIFLTIIKLRVAQQVNIKANLIWVSKKIKKKIDPSDSIKKI